jgi:hypothetical protein
MAQPASSKNLWARIAAWIDDALPMPPDQREERDETQDAGTTDAELSKRRQTRLRIRAKEKEGKGTWR